MTHTTFLRFVRVSIGSANVLFYMLIAHTAKYSQKATNFLQLLKYFQFYRKLRLMSMAMSDTDEAGCRRWEKDGIEISKGLSNSVLLCVWTL